MSGAIIIAEAGVNHNADLDIALRMIEVAKKAGADIVKFQTAIPEMVISRFAAKAQYQIQNTAADENQLDMCKKLHFSLETYTLLMNKCAQEEIAFLSTPFDLVSIRYLHDECKMALWKIPSGEITNLPYLVKIANYHQPVLMSTGMSTMDEVETAVNALRSSGCDDITLLHCTTEYPAPYQDVNLKAMLTMRNHFGLPVGYSDHTMGIEVPIAAVAMGATAIEKHFTLDRSMEGPDQKASLEPKEFADMVKAIRHIEVAMGDGVKRPGASEEKNLAIARKSIVANRPIKKGDTFSGENLTVKRPGSGLSPMRWYEILGLVSDKDYQEDEEISWPMI